MISRNFSVFSGHRNHINSHGVKGGDLMRTGFVTYLTCLFVFILYSCPTFAATVHVPGDHPTIQAGIDAAAEGDTVLVAPGTYYENLSLETNILLKSEDGPLDTIIDGGGPGRRGVGNDRSRPRRLHDQKWATGDLHRFSMES